MGTSIPAPQGPTNSDSAFSETSAMRTLTFLGVPIHRRIRTGQKHLPWGAVFIITLIWFTWGFHIFAGGLALTFTIKHYTNDPRWLALIKYLPMLLLIGPFVSYISDKVWTPLGRRRPFMILAWAGGAIGMFAFAFLPQINKAINGTLGTLSISPLPEIAILTAIMMSYIALYDLQTPMEPLFLECVPPHQRGRFWAMRNIVFSLAVTLFFQVLWPVYDEYVDFGRYYTSLTTGKSFLDVGPTAVGAKGETLIYLLAGCLFTITGAFMLCNITEVKDPKADNLRFRELRLWTFTKGFFRDVFFRAENIPFYVVLIIPGIEGMVWGDFGNVMQNDQFKYSKGNQALWAFPMQMIGMFALTPLAGWYSDIRVRFNFWMKGLMLVGGVALVAVSVWCYGHWTPRDIRELPPLWEITVLSATISAGTACLFIFLVESMLDYTGREHSRAWVSLLAIFLQFANAIALYVHIELSPGRVIPITMWMVYGVMSAAYGALLATFVGPMIYEYMPRSIMGTINAGSGLISSLVKFGASLLGGWWVFWWSAHVFKPSDSDYDYTSLYILQFLLFVPAIAAKIWFMREILARRVLKWGVMEVEGEPQPERIKEDELLAGVPATEVEPAEAALLAATPANPGTAVK
jgi:MFS family permease